MDGQGSSGRVGSSVLGVGKDKRRSKATILLMLVLLWLIPCSVFAQMNPAGFPIYNPHPIKWWKASQAGSGPRFSNMQEAVNVNYQSYILGGQHGGWCVGCTIESVQWLIDSSGPHYEMTCHSSMFNQSGYCGTVRPEPAWTCQEGSSIADPMKYPNGCAPNNNKGCPDDCAPAKSSPGLFGDPINAATGNKYETKTEFRGTGLFPLEFTWTYNSAGGPSTDRLLDATLGFNRTDNYRRRVVAFDYGTSKTAYVARPDGDTPRFDLSGSSWIPVTEKDGILSSTFDTNGTVTSWTYRNDRNETESYDASGRLQSIKDAAGYVQTLAYDGSGRVSQVTDMRGRTLSFAYNTSNRLTSLSLPDGGLIQFAYDAANNLQTVTYPDLKTRGYLYNEQSYTSGTSLPHALTGETDESGARFSTTTYDTAGRATGTFLGSNVDAHTATYTSSSDGTYVSTAVITSPLGMTRTVNFQMISGRAVPQSSNETCPGCVTRSESFGYTSSSRMSSFTDAAGVLTDYTVDANGLETQRIEASNDTSGNKRTIQTDWNSTIRMPIERRTYNAAGGLVARQTWTHNSRGQVLAATRIDPTTAATSTTTTTYCEQADVAAGTCPLVGLVRSIDGPRIDASDITTYTYYATDDATCASAPATCPHRKGDLWKVTNALGHVTETLSYDGTGRPLSVKDPNGVVTDMTYSPRGWLTARKVRGTNGAVETDDAITSFAYRPTGLVQQMTQPDGSYTSYAYDAAHRLTDVSDNTGANIHYTLDNAGNRIQEDTKESSGALTRTLSRVYNQLGQLQSQRDAALNATTFTYGPTGNTDLVTDPASHVTDNDYDPLNRLSRTLQDVGGIAANTQFQYDAVDNLTQVTDPNGLATGYSYDGLGNLTSLSSPDTGTTSYTYDVAGNRKSQTDARGRLTNYTYDALNRLATQTYSVSSLNVTPTYDTVNSVCTTGETFAVGRLSRLTMGNGNNTQYCYDRFGNMVRKVETINTRTFTLRYGYNLAGRMTSVTYPDGGVADYIRNALGQVAEIGVTRSGGSRQVLLTGAVYYPFGPARQWTFGNGRTFQRTVDLDYRPWAISDTASGGLSLGYTFDASGNLAELRDASQTGVPQATFGYDALNRLTDFLDGPTGATIEHYAYDATGNRTLFQNSSGTQTYAYNTGTHRLRRAGSINRWFDASGNTISIGGTALEYTFTSANRMDSVSRYGAVVMNYRYNGKGERVHAFLTTTGTNQTYTVYDEAGHWAGDYGSTSTPTQQAIWLDDLPVGLLVGSGGGQTLNYVEADSLGTPRAVIDPTRNVAVWNWSLKSEAFGNSPPSQDPDMDGFSLVFNLRFPGQTYDSASGLNYNYRRDYEPGTGRYVESDPIGLKGGPNSYAYTNSKPFVLVDPLGLAAECGDRDCCKNVTWAQKEGGVVGGTVRCCGGKALACINPNICDGLAPDACEILTRCARRHENLHSTSHVSCVGKSDGPALPNPPFNKYSSECAAYTDEVGCLSKVRCTTVMCEREIGAAQRHAVRQREKYCAVRGGAP